MPTFFEYNADCIETEGDYIQITPINGTTRLWIGATNGDKDCSLILSHTDVQRLYDHLTVYLQEVKTEASGTSNQPK